MRSPSAPCAGFIFSPATSAESTLAPLGNVAFKNGCDWLRTMSLTSVSDRPLDVINQCSCGGCWATAAWTFASAKRVQARAKVGGSVGFLKFRKAPWTGAGTKARRKELVSFTSLLLRPPPSIAVSSIAPTPSTSTSPISHGCFSFAGSGHLV